MKKYPFPPGVTFMSEADYREHCAAEHQKAQAVKAERKARAARRMEAQASGPVARITALEKGASVLLPGYTRTTQTSSAIRAAYINTGNRYTSALARDLLTGESVIGVTVTRVE